MGKLIARAKELGVPISFHDRNYDDNPFDKKNICVGGLIWKAIEELYPERFDSEFQKFIKDESIFVEFPPPRHLGTLLEKLGIEHHKAQNVADSITLNNDQRNFDFAWGVAEKELCDL